MLSPQACLLSVAMRYSMMPVGLSVVCAAAQALHSLLHVMWIQHAARLVASQMATCPQ